MASTIAKIAAATAFAFIMCGIAVQPAMAEHQNHYRGGWHHGNRHYHDRHQWRRGGYEYGPGVSYYAPSPYVYYAPPPVVYYPPRPSRGLNLFFPFSIR
jgi:hypothetical protein